MQDQTDAGLWVDQIVKEGQEQRWRLLGGFVLCLGYPLLSQPYQWVKQRARGWVYAVLAVHFLLTTFLGLGITTADLFSFLGIPGVPLLVYVFGWFLVTTIINLLLYSVILAVEYPSLLAREFRAAGQDAVHGWLEDVLGHKVWAGPKTSDLLTRLVENYKGRRAKWLMVNFLARVVDDLVSLPNPHTSFRVETHRRWKLLTYSEFLAGNTSHADDTIWWQVAPSDFFEILLPDFIAYALAISAFARYGTPHAHVGSIGTPAETFPAEAGYPGQALAQVCARLSMDPNTVPQEVTQAEDDGMRDYKFFRIVLLNIAKEFGLEAISANGHLALAQVRQRFARFLVPQYLGRLLPHVKAFQDAQPSRGKLRLVFFGPVGQVDKRTTAISQIERFWPTEAPVKTPQLSWPRWAEATQEDVLKQALELFADTCGGKPNVWFASSDEDTTYAYGDVGIYDRRLRIQSVGDDERTVTVSYWPQDEPPEADLFRAVEAAISKQPAPKITVVGFEPFTQHILSYARCVGAPTP